MGGIRNISFATKGSLVDGYSVTIIGINFYPSCVDMHDGRLVIVLIGHRVIEPTVFYMIIIRHTLYELCQK